MNLSSSRSVGFVCLLALSTSLGAISTTFAQVTVSETVARQIQSLAEEKRARTAAQKKIDSQLLYATKMARGEAITSEVPTLAVDVPVTRGRATVDIVGTISPALLRELAAKGATVINSMPAYNSVRVEIGLDRLEAIAGRAEVRSIMAARAPNVVGASRISEAVSSEERETVMGEKLATLLAPKKPDAPEVAVSGQHGSPAPTTGAARTEGDRTHRADTARGAFNTDGTGVKIGVLGDGGINVASAQASGDVPGDLVILPGQAGSGDTGTAMLEVIHDLAPGAKLYFATSSGGVVPFANNIRQLRAAGCDIIVDGTDYIQESPFQDGQVASIVSNTNGGIVTQAVKEVTAGGALYFSLAGEGGNKNDNFSSVWEGDFTNGGTLAIIGGAGAGPVNDFDPSAAVSQFDKINAVLAAGEITLFWSDPLGASTNDYDLYILNSTGTALVAASTGSQDGSQDPFEVVGSGANIANERIVVAKFAGADRYLHVNAFRSILQFSTPGRIKGHSLAAEAFCVAATSGARGTGPFPNPFNSSNMVETSSADGPRRIFFNADGSPITPGNFSSTGGIVRQKPDITAADNVRVSGAGGFATLFSGTAAAASHAGAIAALLKSANAGLTNGQIRTALTSSAIDIEAPGVDRDSGFGIIMAYEALQAAGLTPGANVGLGSIVATESGGNGNAVVEAGEQGSLFIELTNVEGGATATGITATLTSNTPGVSVAPPATSAYPDVAPGATSGNSMPFTFAASGDVACPLDDQL